MQYIAVFSIRNHTMQFSLQMNRKGYHCEIISTPKRITSVCGISAKFNVNGLAYARSLAKTYSSFIGIYALENNYMSPNGKLFRKM